MAAYRILPAGDSALTFEFGNEISPAVNRSVKALYDYLETHPVDGICETIPTFRSLSVIYDPRRISYEELCGRLRAAAEAMEQGGDSFSTVYHIPVCYGGAFGPDLEIVAAHAGLAEEEVVRLHTSRTYLIYMLGFLPGFAYLGGLDPKIATPRLPSPRTAIPAGAVGIGGEQTGIYPMASPGGWNLIGRTPVRPYDPHRQPPILYKAGNSIRFFSVDEQTYRDIAEQVGRGQYQCRTETIRNMVDADTRAKS